MKSSELTMVHLPPTLKRKLTHQARIHSMALEEVICEFLAMVVDFVDEDEEILGEPSESGENRDQGGLLVAAAGLAVVGSEVHHQTSR